ncbi:hypothetical protein ABDK75_10445 [Gluconobacter sp. OJA]|uniref:hypothetical protein n=1 Tax=Gluconobacter sp. OJA TaxID=3145197 RepID=UPI0031F8A323
MSLPAGEARQSHIILQVRTINGSDFELTVFPSSTATYRRSFPYPARVEGSARIFAASVEGGIPRPVGVKGALLALMNKCQEALAEPVSEKTVVDYLVSLQSSYETVQACLIGSMPDQQEG